MIDMEIGGLSSTKGISDGKISQEANFADKYSTF